MEIIGIVFGGLGLFFIGLQCLRPPVDLYDDFAVRTHVLAGQGHDGDQDESD